MPRDLNDPSAAVPGAGAAQVVELDPRTDPRWSDLVLAAGGSLFHSPAWMSVLADAYGFSARAYVTLDAQGSPRGGIPWCEVSDPGGARVVSIPFGDFCGPISTASGGATEGALLDALVQRGLPVRYRIVTDASAPEVGHVTATARWHGVPVTDSPDADVWPLLTSATRRAVAKARRESVTVVERSDAAFVPQFLRLHTGIRKYKYRLLPQPLAFFEAIRARFGATDDWHPLVAMRDDQIIAATVYVHHGDALYYKFNASDPEELASRPNDLLLWSGIEMAARLGCRLVDLGASDDDQPGLVRFKRGFGADEREIRSLTCGPSFPTMYSAFREMLGEFVTLLTEPEVPDAVVEHAGAQLYRYFA